MKFMMIEIKLIFNGIIDVLFFVVIFVLFGKFDLVRLVMLRCKCFEYGLSWKIVLRVFMFFVWLMCCFLIK